MDFNDYSNNQGGQSQQNRFIFSDDYYDNMPLDSDNKLDVARKVEPYIEPTKTNSIASAINQDVHQVNDFDRMVNNDYNDSGSNTFDFFGHNVNTELNNDLYVPPTIETPVVEPVMEDIPVSNDNKTGLFQSLENSIFNKKQEEENIVHLDKPLVEEDSYNLVNSYDIIQNQEVQPVENIEIPGPLEPLEYVDPTGVDNTIIDNIVDYQANIPQEVNLGEDNSKFIVNDEPNTLLNDKPNEISIPNFMESNQKINNLEIDTGINLELEKELMKQKELEEEEKLKNNPQLADYLQYTPQEETTEILYRAGGKSIVREKQAKPVIQNISVTPVIEPVSVEPEVVNIDEEQAKQPQSISDMIEDILDIPNLDELVVPIDQKENPGVVFGGIEVIEEPVDDDKPTTVYDEKKDNFNYDQNFENVEVKKSDLLDKLKEQADQQGKVSILARYGEDFCSKDYITNPAIGRAEEIKQLILILLTPEKSGILIGKPGIGKTSIVEGLAYQLQRDNVPDALKGYVIVSVKTASLLGTLPTGETRLQTLVDELKDLDKIILFVDEIHMLIGATNESALDFANMFKESLGRGSIKVIGATTTEEYERYILRDKAFVRRFQKVEVQEPDREHTIKILLGTLPKIEKNTGAKLKYTDYIQSEIMAFIVDITTEYKRIYGIGSRYPDICLTLLAQAFSQAVFANRKEVTIIDIRKAIENSKNIYPDVIRKELVNFDKKFKDIIREEQI